MNIKKNNLSKQLLLLVGIAFILLFISLGVVLPQMLIPVAEQTIYSYLSEPLKMYDNDTDNKLLNTEIAYIYISENTITTSFNIREVISFERLEDIQKKMKDSYGKFIFNHKTYYYYTLKKDAITKIAISDDSYINRTKASIISAIFPLVFGTFLLIGLMLVYWSSHIVRKIEIIIRWYISLSVS